MADCDRPDNTLELVGWKSLARSADLNMPSNPSPDSRTITFSRVVDLSRTVHPKIPVWPGDPSVELEDVAHIAGDGFFLRRFSMGEHTATHMNSPASFHADGETIDAYLPESLVAPAVVIDVREETQADSDYALTIGAVKAWENIYGPIPAGSVVLLHTGWQEKWDSPCCYLGLDQHGHMSFPGFGVEAACYLLSERGAAGLGIDTHGLEPGASEGFPVNSLALEQPRLALENLANLDRLPPTGAIIVIGIIRLEGGSGSPVSVLAFLP